MSANFFGTKIHLARGGACVYTGLNAQKLKVELGLDGWTSERTSAILLKSDL